MENKQYITTVWRDSRMSFDVYGSPEGVITFVEHPARILFSISIQDLEDIISRVECEEEEEF